MGGIFLGLTFTDNNSVLWIVLGIIFVFLGTLGFSFLDNAQVKIWRVYHAKFGQIGILVPYEINLNNSSFLDLSSREIVNSLLSANIKFTAIGMDRLIFEYPVVINPYGGAYPEANKNRLSSLKKIFRYVSQGGVFVNITDIPFYYAYDSFLKRRIDITPQDHEGLRHFNETVLSQRLGLDVFGYGPNYTKRIISIREGCINLDNIIPLRGAVYSEKLAVPYGKGFFVFSTIRLNYQNVQIIPEVVKKAIGLAQK